MFRRSFAASAPTPGSPRVLSKVSIGFPSGRVSLPLVDSLWLLNLSESTLMVTDGHRQDCCAAALLRPIGSITTVTLVPL